MDTTEMITTTNENKKYKITETITCPAKDPEKSDATQAAIEEDHEENQNKMLEENDMISTWGNSETKEPQKYDAIEEDYNEKSFVVLPKSSE